MCIENKVLMSMIFVSVMLRAKTLYQSGKILPRFIFVIFNIGLFFNRCSKTLTNDQSCGARVSLSFNCGHSALCWKSIALHSWEVREHYKRLKRSRYFLIMKHWVSLNLNEFKCCLEASAAKHNRTRKSCYEYLLQITTEYKLELKALLHVHIHT